jgi:hypothetical protein
MNNEHTRHHLFLSLPSGFRCLVPLQMFLKVQHLHFKATIDGDQFSFILTCFVRIVLPPW